MLVQEQENMCTISLRKPEINGVAVYMPTELYGVQTKFLIDTGASVTVLSRAMYEQIPRERRPELTTPNTQTRLEVADQSYLSVDGIALISLQAGGMSFEWSVYVAPICDEGLLGMDFLDAHEYPIGDGPLELNGQPVKTDVVVPAYSEFIVDGRAKYDGPAIGIIEPDTAEQVPAPAAAPAVAPAVAPAAAQTAAAAPTRAQAPVPQVMHVGQGVDRHWTIGTIVQLMVILGTVSNFVDTITKVVACWTSAGWRKLWERLRILLRGSPYIAGDRGTLWERLRILLRGSPYIAGDRGTLWERLRILLRGSPYIAGDHRTLWERLRILLRGSPYIAGDRRTLWEKLRILLRGSPYIAGDNRKLWERLRILLRGSPYISGDRGTLWERLRILLRGSPYIAGDRGKLWERLRILLRGSPYIAGDRRTGRDCPAAGIALHSWRSWNAMGEIADPTAGIALHS